MAFSKNENDPYPDVYRVEVATGKSRRVKSSLTGVEYWYVDDTGEPRIGRGMTNKGREVMRIYDPATDKWESFESYPGLTPNTPIYEFLKNGTELIIGDYKGRDTLGLYVYNLSSRSITRMLFHNDEYDASGVVLSADGETVIGAKYVADQEETELLGNYGTSLSQLRSKFKGYSVRYVDQTDDYQKMIVRMSAPYEPGGLYIYNRGDATPSLLQNRYSDLVPEDMGNVFPIKYSARDGQKIPAFITLPPTVTTQAGLKTAMGNPLRTPAVITG